ncbi:MAG TPA: hypothetical protein VNM90_08765 [Haliangium sp.]|nr:hypothetical protein [Haliangium sp.]
MDWWLLALAAMGVMAVYRIKARHDDQRRKSVWRKVALSRGGSYHEQQGLLSATIDAIDVDVDQIRVQLDRYAEGSETRRIYTRCRARYLLPHGPGFSIYAEGVLASIGKALGGQDVTLGADPAFDEQFIVKCEDVEAVRRVWSLRATRIMRRSFDSARIESDGAEIVLQTQEPLEVPGLVNEVLDLVAELAGADLFGTEALRALPDAAYEPPTGPWDERTIPFVVVGHPVPVTIAPALLGRRVVTRATVGDGPRDRPLKILVRSDGSAEPADSVAQLPPAAAGFLRRAGNGTLVVDGASTSFTWLGVETEPGRLMAGVGLLAALAGAPSQGVYR